MEYKVVLGGEWWKYEYCNRVKYGIYLSLVKKNENVFEGMYSFGYRRAAKGKEDVWECMYGFGYGRVAKRKEDLREGMYSFGYRRACYSQYMGP